VVVGIAWKLWLQVIEATVDRLSGMGGIARSLWILDRVFYAFIDETVIIIAGGEALFHVLYILINGKGSRSPGPCRTRHRLSS
jgi:hypothetical protein